MLACKNSGFMLSDHFANVSKMMPIGKGGTRKGADYQLSRYAFYLIAQNGAPARKAGLFPKFRHEFQR